MTIWKGTPLGFEQGRPLSHDGNEPLVIIGPPGSNKSVGIMAAALLDEEGDRSFFVWDPKLELAPIAANWRRKVCGAKNVHVMNAYKVHAKARPDLKSSKWNPIDLDPTSPTLGDECVATGDAAVPSDSNEMQKHFTLAARSCMTGAIKAEIIMSAKEGLPPSFPAVRAALSLEPDKRQAWLKKVLATGDFDVVTRLSRLAADNDEVGSVTATIESSTSWMSDSLRDDMVPAKGEGVDFAALRKRPTTIFCGLPPNEDKPAYMRMVLSGVMRACYQWGGVPVTLLIDEAYLLGRHDEVLRALAVLRGFNCRIILCYQSLEQVQEHYPKTSGLFTGGAVLAFRPGDVTTAQWLHARANKTFVPILSAGDPSSPSDVGAKPSWAPQERDRIPLGKLYGMPKGKALVWLPGDEEARISDVRGYFDIPKLNRRADPNPYFTARGNSAARVWLARVAAAVVFVAALGGSLSKHHVEIPAKHVVASALAPGFDPFAKIKLPPKPRR